MTKNKAWNDFAGMRRYVDNCVVCNKYLKTIGEKEQLMCIGCDETTSEISREQLIEDCKKHGI